MPAGDHMREDLTLTSRATPRTVATGSDTRTSRFERHPKRTLLVIWCVLLLLVELGFQFGARVFREDFIGNGAFRSAEGEAPDGWTPVNASMRVIPDGGGGNALRIAQLDADVGYARAATASPLVVGRAYRLSFEVRAEGDRGQFFAALCEGHRTGCQVGRSGAAGPEFSRYELPFVSGSDSTLTLELHSYSSEPGASPTVYRRVSLVETPPEAFASPPVTEIENELTHHDATPDSQFVTNPSPPDGFAPALNEINSYGIRGPELGPKAARRVLFVGDSFVQADEVSFEDTFGQRLNRLFGGRYEFIAHGVSSWAPTTEFSWIHHRGMALQPDEVVLFICSNDFYPWATYARSDGAYRAQVVWEDFIPVRYVGVEKREALDAPGRYRVGRFLRGVLGQIETMKRAYFGLRALFSTPLTDVDTVVLFSLHAAQWPRALRRNVDETIETIARLGDYLDDRGVGFAVVVVPSGLRWKDEVVSVKQMVPRWRQLVEASGLPPGEFSLSETGLVSHLQGRLASHGIAMIDLGPAFDAAKAGRRALLFNPLDGHWNADGHVVVAAAIAERFDR
jgi:hypothetical protein